MRPARPFRRPARATLAAPLAGLTVMALVSTMTSAQAAPVGVPPGDGAPSGMVRAWGNDLYGVLDVPASAQDGAVAVAAGGMHALALTGAGEVVAWGAEDGQLPDWAADYGQADVPQAARSGVAAIAAGYHHSLALKNGEVLAWGAVDRSDDDSDDNTVTVDVGQVDVPAAALSNVSAISAGWFHSLALKDGGVLAWGSPGAATEVPASATSGTTAISAGPTHNLAVVDGGVVAWGEDRDGSTTVPGDATSGVTAVAAGYGFSLALKDGAVLAWGSNDRGETDVPAQAGSGVVAIAAGSFQATALKSDGTVIAWGHNTGGQGSVPDEAASDGIAVASGNGFNLALGSADDTDPEPEPEPEPTVVTVTARSFSLPFGDDLPARTYTVSGLAAGDSLTTEPTCSVVGGLSVGKHVHRCTGGTAGPGYTLRYAAGQVTVRKAGTTLTMQELPSSARFAPRAWLYRTHDAQRLSGQQIVFRSGGSRVCAATTDARGLATCGKRVKVGQRLVAAYAGNARYVASERVRRR